MNNLNPNSGYAETEEHLREKEKLLWWNWKEKK